MELGKKGFFFSVDALIAIFIVFLVLLIYTPSTRESSSESELHSDIIKSLSSLKVGDADNNYVRAQIAGGQIRNLNNSLLEQIGEFYSVNKSQARELTSAVLDDLKTDENIGIWYGSDLIFSVNKTPIENAKQIDISRQIISGLQEGPSSTGFAARAYLQSTARTDYYYFGGYTGEGNFSVLVNYSGTLNSVYVELAINKSYSVYVNGNQAIGSFPVSASELQPVDFNIDTSYFSQGSNLIEFRGNGLYAAGGFVRINYRDGVSFNKSRDYYFPGVDGIINIYDGVYVGQNLTSISAYLHLNSSSAPVFLTFGNVTIWNGTADGVVVLGNSSFSDALPAYSTFADKTVPLRIGIKNATFTGQTRPADVFSVTDLSGSMLGQKITNAKNATKVLIDAILNYSNNRVGLAGYDTYARANYYTQLSNNSAALKNFVTNNWNVGSNTCICCGILRAINCYDEKVFVDSFNGQNVGSNPSRWTVYGSARITSQALEGNRAVIINRTINTQYGMTRNFAPQDNPIFVEFKFNQISGTGKLRVQIGDYINGNYISVRANGTGLIQNQAGANWVSVANYSSNRNYSIGLLISPGAGSYTLYVNGTAYPGLAVSSTKSNVGYIGFFVENATGAYLVDDVRINLTQKLCSEPGDFNRSRSMIVMSDGQANQECGLTGNAKEDAINASCIAFSDYNITVYTVGFGTDADSATLTDMAQCGNGTAYSSSDITQLGALYQQIAQDIIATSYFGQTVSSNSYSKIYPDSHISFSYGNSAANNPYGLVLNLEQNFSNSTFGRFNVPADSAPLSAQVASYSGAKWTNNIFVNKTAFYNLSSYGSDYLVLGDPYSISIPISKVQLGENNVTLSTATSPTNASVGSQYNKIIYSVVKNVTSFSNVLASAQGCAWNIQFRDGSQLNAPVPSSYAGSDNCYYNQTLHSVSLSPPSSVANSNDAYQAAVFNLLSQLDIDSDGKVDVLFSTEDVQINLDQITGIPFVAFKEVQIKRWLP